MTLLTIYYFYNCLKDILAFTDSKLVKHIYATFYIFAFSLILQKYFD